MGKHQGTIMVAYTKTLIWHAGGGGEDLAALVGDALSNLGDLERGITRALHGTTSPTEFAGVLRALGGIAAKLGVRAGEDVGAMEEGVGGCAVIDGLSSSLLRDLLRAAASREVSALMEAAAPRLALLYMPFLHNAVHEASTSQYNRCFSLSACRGIAASKKDYPVPSAVHNSSITQPAACVMSCCHPLHPYKMHACRALLHR
jgi:hypothetical protein